MYDVDKCSAVLKNAAGLYIRSWWHWGMFIHCRNKSSGFPNAVQVGMLLALVS